MHDIRFFVENVEAVKINLGLRKVDTSCVDQVIKMKGRRKEMIREELHLELTNGFGVEKIHSEYGMTELLSQAYSKGDGVLNAPLGCRF